MEIIRMIVEIKSGPGCKGLIEAADTLYEVNEGM